MDEEENVETIEVKIGKDQFIDVAMGMIRRELMEATAQHGSFHSLHEGWAVILEELDELWDEVKKRSKERDLLATAKEATQVGAMAARFLVDLVLPSIFLAEKAAR